MKRFLIAGVLWMAAIVLGLLIGSSMAGCVRVSDDYLIRQCGPVEDSARWMHCCLTTPVEGIREWPARRDIACRSLVSWRGAEGDRP